MKRAGEGAKSGIKKKTHVLPSISVSLRFPVSGGTERGGNGLGTKKTGKSPRAEIRKWGEEVWTGVRANPEFVHSHRGT